MQYHLDTIPVWEALEAKGECLFCALLAKAEQMEIDRSLGGSVMEPDTRIRVNERGICQRHHRLLIQKQNRLGHALLTDSHTKELLKKLEKMQNSAGKSGSGWFGAKRTDGLETVIGQLEAMTQSCVICEGLQTHMERYAYTFLHLFGNDSKFREQWESSKGACIPHTVEVLRFAQKHAGGEKQRQLANSLLALLKNNLTENEKDLEWFTLKFDYRNQDKPWGNSKNALERTVNRLRGWCVGEDAEKQP